MTPTRQLTLDMPARQAMGREDFFVTEANTAVVAVIDQWPNWPSYGAIISGPPGSGKTHLAEVFRSRSQAEIAQANDIVIDAIPHLLQQPALVIENLARDLVDAKAVFHLLNLVKTQQKTVLITTVLSTATLTFALPDLTSRLQSLPLLCINPPDDALLRGVLLKNFMDRQLTVSDPIISYILQRMPRSLEAARTIVAKIDSMALAEGAAITRPFVSHVLSDMVNLDLFPE
jgi:chromosomal replication initiation ATPase DnaA